jgi:hypothetical protein
VLRSNEKLPQSTGSVREEELAKEVKRWMRKYNELTDLSDDVRERLSICVSVLISKYIYNADLCVLARLTSTFFFFFSLSNIFSCFVFQFLYFSHYIFVLGLYYSIQSAARAR